VKLKYEPGQTFLHRLSPLTKLVTLVLFSLTIFLLDSLAVELLCLLSLLLTGALTRSQGFLSLATSKYLASFGILLFVIQVLFNAGGEVYFTIPLWLVHIDVTSSGLMVGLIVAIRFVCVILASAIFVFTTDPGELAYALMRAGLPYRYGFMLVTAIRFMPVFESEAGTVSCAQKARGLDIDSGGVRAVIRSARYTLLPLVVSALSRVDVLVISMEGRAFGRSGHRTFLRKGRFGKRDAIIIALAILIFGLLLLDATTGWIPLPQISIYNN
jgi:energy-coupling factor transport system permease protein